jgi:transposase, IS5 family
MQPKLADATPELPFDLPPLAQWLNPNEPLKILADTIDWQAAHDHFASGYCAKNGRPGLPIRLLAGLEYLKQTYKYSDEAIVAAWPQNPYWQYFCGERYFTHTRPIDPSQMTRFRHRIGADGATYLLKLTIDASLQLALLKTCDIEEVIIDTTVQVKAIAPPTDTQLCFKARVSLTRIAQKCGIKLKQSFVRIGKKTRYRYSKSVHRKNYKEARKQARLLKTQLGRIIRDVERKLDATCTDADVSNISTNVRKRIGQVLDIAKRIASQIKQQKRQPGAPRKLASVHAPEVTFIAKGKAHKKWETGSKVGIAVTRQGGVVVAMCNYPDAPHDKDTLAPTLAQIKDNTGVTPKLGLVDRGYAGHGITTANSETTIAKSGQTKGLTLEQQQKLKQRSAIEPAIGHMKSDGFLGRNYLKGEIGDAINAVMCGVGWNLRKLLRYLWERLLLLLLAFDRAQRSPYGVWRSVLAMMATFLCCQNNIIFGNTRNYEPPKTIKNAYLLRHTPSLA